MTHWQITQRPHLLVRKYLSAAKCLQRHWVLVSALHELLRRDHGTNSSLIENVKFFIFCIWQQFPTYIF